MAGILPDSWIALQKEVGFLADECYIYQLALC